MEAACCHLGGDQYIVGWIQELSCVEKKLQQKVVDFLARCGFALTEIPAIMKSGDAFLFKKNCKSLVTDMSRPNEPTHDAVCSLGCAYWFGIHWLVQNFCAKYGLQQIFWCNLWTIETVVLALLTL
jgi:hypothetical protein